MKKIHESFFKKLNTNGEANETVRMPYGSVVTLLADKDGYDYVEHENLNEKDKELLNQFFITECEKFINKENATEESDAREKIEVQLDIEDDDGFLTKVDLYTENGCAYFDRAHYVCSTAYYLKCRFKEDEMTKVLHYIADNSYDGLEGYIKNLEGYELLEMDRSI